MQLLVERAQQVNPAFGLDEGNVRDVVDLCRRLDGIPLALELAAARLRLLTPHEVLQRIRVRFSLLTAERSREDRHRSLAAAIEWSYDLLEELDRAVFRRLGVFEGGFTLAAAEAVASGDGVADGEVVDRLGRLVDASLVTVTPGEPRRFGMLESVHEYAQSLLERSVDEQAVRKRHADHLISLIPDEPAYDTAAYAEARNALAIEGDNFRSALVWAVRADDGTRALSLAARIRLHHSRRDHKFYWFPKVLEISKTSATADRVRVLAFVGHMFNNSPRRDEAPAILEEARQLTSQLGDDALAALEAGATEAGYLEAGGQLGEAMAINERLAATLRRLGDPGLSLILLNLAMFAITCGQYEKAARSIDEHEMVGRQLGQPRTPYLVAFSRGMLAHYRGDLHVARQLLLESLGGLRRLQYASMLRNVLAEISQVSLESGALEEGDASARELIDVAHDLLYAPDLAFGYDLLARAELRRGNIGLAVSAAREALQVAVECGNAIALVRLAAMVGQIVSAAGDAWMATELHAVAETMRRQMGLALPKHRERELAQAWAALRQALGVHAFRIAWQRGRMRGRAQLGESTRRVLDSIGT